VRWTGSLLGGPGLPAERIGFRRLRLRNRETRPLTLEAHGDHGVPVLRASG